MKRYIKIMVIFMIITFTLQPISIVVLATNEIEENIVKNGNIEANKEKEDIIPKEEIEEPKEETMEDTQNKIEETTVENSNKKNEIKENAIEDLKENEEDKVNEETKEDTNVEEGVLENTQKETSTTSEEPTVYKMNKQTISNGIYKIKSVADETKLLDIDEKTENIRLWEYKESKIQQFKIKYIPTEGCYTIKSLVTGKYLDIYGGYSTPGTNVQQWISNGTDGQKWLIEETQNGYAIRSKISGLHLDIYGGYTANGTNVQMWTSNNTKGQRFLFEQVNKTSERLIEDGIYQIQSAIDNTKQLETDSSENVILWSNKKQNSQKFEFEYIEKEKCYLIKSVATGKYLDVYGGYLKPGTNVQVWQYNNTDGQKWILEKTNYGYGIISKSNGLYLDLYGGYSSDGTNIQMWYANQTKGQSFKIEQIKKDEQEEYAKTIGDGIYKIRLASNKNRVVEIKDSSIKAEANVQVGEDSYVKNQLFNIKYTEKEGYQIEAIHSGKMLDVYGGYKNPGVNVQQYHDNQTDGQKWNIVDLGDGTYNIISKCNGLYLDIYGGYTRSGNQYTNVEKKWNYRAKVSI